MVLLYYFKTLNPPLSTLYRTIVGPYLKAETQNVHMLLNFNEKETIFPRGGGIDCGALSNCALLNVDYETMPRLDTPFII